MKKLLFWMVMFTCSGVYGQSLVMEESLMDSSKQKIGPNRSHYAQFFEQFGVIPPSEPTANWFSGSFTIGGYYRYQIAEPLGVGVVGMLQFSRIGLSTDSLDGLSVNRTRNTYNQLVGGPFVRIHFTKRGDFLGGYLDGGLLYGNVFRSKQKFSTASPNADKVKVVRVNPSSSRTWISGFYGVLQYQHVGVYGMYRLESPDRQIELPRLELGLRIAI